MMNFKPGLFVIVCAVLCIFCGCNRCQQAVDQFCEAKQAGNQVYMDTYRAEVEKLCNAEDQLKIENCP